MLDRRRRRRANNKPALVQCILPAGTANKRRPNVGLMLDNRLRRWSNIDPTLGQRFV